MKVSATVTELLARVRSGDGQALRDLFPLVYDELRRVARAQRHRQGASPTLNTTALVHEAFLKLAASERPSFQDRVHFMAVAAIAMRQILIGEARRRSAARRGGGSAAVSFSDIQHALEFDAGFSNARADALLALDRALSRLQQDCDRRSRVVDCRFFGGMSIDETAAALGISTATVKREWSLARAWLYREMREELP